MNNTDIKVQSPDDELIDKVMEVEVPADVCKEAKSYLAYFPEVDLIDAV